MPSDLESGSERENVLSVFHDHPDLTLPGEHIDLDELLLDDPRHLIYKLDQEYKYPAKRPELGEREYLAQSEIEIYRSDPYLNGQGILLEALITYRGVLDASFVKQKFSHIVNAYSSSDSYIEKDTGDTENHLAVMRIPEDLDSEQLQTSVDAAVKMLKAGVDLQKKVMEAASSN